jgi:hypothetical protein
VRRFLELDRTPLRLRFGDLGRIPGDQSVNCITQVRRRGMALIPMARDRATITQFAFVIEYQDYRRNRGADRSGHGAILIEQVGERILLFPHATAHTGEIVRRILPGIAATHRHESRSPSGEFYRESYDAIFPYGQQCAMICQQKEYEKLVRRK